MSRITNISEAIMLFEYAAKQHTEATLSGNNKKANKNYKKAIDAINYLQRHNQLYLLNSMLTDENPGVRTWAAYYLFPTEQGKCTCVLREVGRLNDVIGGNARIILEQLQKGNIK